jgi:hypothetical protein
LFCTRSVPAIISGRKRELQVSATIIPQLIRFLALNREHSKSVHHPPPSVATPTMGNAPTYIENVPGDIIRHLIQFIDLRSFENFTLAFPHLLVWFHCRDFTIALIVAGDSTGQICETVSAF